MIDAKTMQVLKNYASINPNIVIENGNVIKTISEAKNVMSKSTIDVSFPKKFGIFDLNEFLATLNLVNDPSLDFSDNFVTIKDSVGRSKIKYYYSDIDILTSPTKDIVSDDYDWPVKFFLDAETFSKLRRASSVLGHNLVSVNVIDNIVSLTVQDNEDNTSNAFTIAVDGTFTDENFNFVFNINNLKMIDDDYHVRISSKKLSHFVNSENKIEYWVALEKSSTYGE